MSIRKRSDVSFVKKSLPCPLYAADFDPCNRGYLVVGGGGGESKTGVANQISVLDVSNRAEITTAVDIELSRDEDNVQSLASLSTKDGLIVFAGINSSMKDQNAGKNEHLRSFEVKCPPRKKQKTEAASGDEKGEWSLLGKRSLFKTSTAATKETYQRILRLSRSRKQEAGTKRIGAIASSMAKESEIIVFDATTTVPDKPGVLATVELPDGQEAADLDLAEQEDGEFSLVYCTDYDLNEQTYKYDFKSKKTEKTPKGPRRVRQMPFPDAMESPGSRPKFRSVRFLNESNVVALLNKPNKKGAVLQIFHLYPTGPAILIQEKSLPRHIKSAVSMDVCTLDAGKDGDLQVVVAIAGQDQSIEVYTTDYRGKWDTFSNFKGYLTLRDVHEQGITKICFSTFRPPTEITKSSSPKQHIRLASVSMGNTVVVDTFPVTPLDTRERSSRYVLSQPSSLSSETWKLLMIMAVLLAGVAFLLQTIYVNSGTFIEPFSEYFRGQKTTTYYDILPTASIIPKTSPSQILEEEKKELLHDLLSSHSVPHPTSALPDDTEQQPAIILRPAGEADDSTGIVLDTHPDKDALLQHPDTDAKHWHELEEHQKASWKEKLKAAGHWAEEEGETIFKGILFSEYAGAIGAAAADILREL